MASMIPTANSRNFSTDINVTDIITANNGTIFNTTDVYLDVTDVAASEGRPKWRRILDIIQIIVLIWGIVTNLVSAICFRKHPSGFSRQIILIFEHQSWADFICCLIGFLTVVQPVYWSIGFYNLDYIICFVWHAQVVYWFVAANSYYGLVMIAVDRYLAIVKPMLYKNITVTKLYVAIVIMYFLNIFFVWPFAFLVKMDGDKCIAGYAVEGNAGVLLSKVHAVIVTLYEYVTPCVLFVVLYGNVIYTIKKKKAVEGSVNVEKASAQIIKAATAVTGLFIFAIGWAYNYYFWGVLEIGWTFQFNSPMQQIDVLMSSINSSANPVLYYILMPKFRQAIDKHIFKPCARKITPGELTGQAGTTGA